MQLRCAVLYCACAAFWQSPAWSQHQSYADPANPGEAVPSTRHPSAFTGYQSFLDEPLVPWRDVNDEAARVGGHLGIFRNDAHAGHGDMIPPTNTPAPRAPATHPPQAMPGTGQLRMMK